MPFSRLTWIFWLPIYPERSNQRSLFDLARIIAISWCARMLFQEFPLRYTDFSELLKAHEDRTAAKMKAKASPVISLWLSRRRSKFDCRASSWESRISDADDDWNQKGFCDKSSTLSVLVLESTKLCKIDKPCTGEKFDDLRWSSCRFVKPLCREFKVTFANAFLAASFALQARPILRDLSFEDLFAIPIKLSNPSSFVSGNCH